MKRTTFEQPKDIACPRLSLQRRNIKKAGLPIAISILLAVPMSTLTAKAQQQQQTNLDVGPLSTSAAKTFSSSIEGGTRITLSNHGNIIAFNSPFASGRDYEHIGTGALSEGYVLCYAGKNAFDTGETKSGFGAATLSGNTATNVTFTRSTSDGFLRLRQDFGFNGRFRSLTIDMTVTNLNGFTVSGVTLRRQVDFDIDTGGAQGFANFLNDFARTSRDGVFAWNDAQDVPVGREGHGIMLRNIQISAGVSFPIPKVTSNILDSSCSPSSVATPVFNQDIGATLEYNLGTIAPFASKKVTLIYERF